MTGYTQFIEEVKTCYTELRHVIQKTCYTRHDIFYKTYIIYATCYTKCVTKDMTYYIEPNIEEIQNTCHMTCYTEHSTQYALHITLYI